MNEATREKLEHLQTRFKRLEGELADAAASGNTEQYKTYSKEYSQMEPLVGLFAELTAAETQFEQAQQLSEDSDAAIRELAEEEITQTKTQLETIEAAIHTQLYSRDVQDEHNAFLEIRAGTGGDESGLFAGDLLRMYIRYAEYKHWKLEVLDTRHGEKGGYKEAIVHIKGQGVYGLLKFESGVHRVQRVPETESSGRLHTSACTVAVLPEVKVDTEIALDRKDIRTDTFRASGAGGQHVNKTDSAVRLTHLPSGIVVECQEGRSQHKNRHHAMQLLQAKLASKAEEEQIDERAESRKKLVGSGDRSERIRTYNFPQGRITDHRINLTLYKLNDVLSGELQHLITPLSEAEQAKRALDAVGA